MTAVLGIEPTFATAARMQRARGRARVSFKRDPAGTTRLDELWQEGSCKVRLPRVHDGRGPEAVLLNTAGGITGGDHLVFEAEWRDGATATVAGQAAERIYRRSEGVGRVDNHLRVGAGATARWLPQETIVFDGAGLARRMEVDIAATGSLVAAEAVVLGRTAMGEDVRSLSFRDHWRVRRDGRLVYADSVSLGGDTRSVLHGGATGGGARAFATVLAVSADAEARLDALRAVIERAVTGAPGVVECGASAFDGLVVLRMLAADGRALRHLLEPLLVHLTGGPLPRVWSI